MLSSTALFYLVFGTLTQAGGIIGFVKAGSRASLIAGLISGAILDLAGILLFWKLATPPVGLGIGLGITVLLLGRFAPAFFRTRKFMPAGLISLLGFISLLLTITAWSKL